MRFDNILPIKSALGMAVPTSTGIRLPRPVITSAPREPDFELLRRQGKDLRRCGYINGNNDAELRCSPQYSCDSATNGLVPVFGCCNDLACDAGPYMTCVDTFENFCETMAGACDIAANQILTCPTACVTHLMAPTGAGDFNTFHSWSCGPTPTTIMVLRTITGELPPDTVGVKDPETSTEREVVRGTSSTDTLSQAAGSNPTNAPGSNPSGGQTTTSGTTGPSVRTIALIVGSVIGALILLGGIGWAIWWGVRRSRKKKAEAESKAAHQKRFETFNPGGRSEAFLTSEAGISTAGWVLGNDDDRMTVRG